MKISAEFIKSAAGAADFPGDGLPELAMVGRSNVGKSSLINALLRQRVARTSAAPGKTRLANIFRVKRGAAPPFFLVDLPGFGFARGGAETAREFQEITRAYFERVRGRERREGLEGQERLDGREGQEGLEGRKRLEGREGLERQEGSDRDPEFSRPAPLAHPAPPGLPAPPVRPAPVTALLLVDARHPGLKSDLEAWNWLRSTVHQNGAIVATKIDKLARGQRIRAIRELESVFQEPVLPVSAVTGEGLDELWKLIDRLLNKSQPHPRSRRNRL